MTDILYPFLQRGRILRILLQLSFFSLNNVSWNSFRMSRRGLSHSLDEKRNGVAPLCSRIIIYSRSPHRRLGHFQYFAIKDKLQLTISCTCIFVLLGVCVRDELLEVAPQGQMGNTQSFTRHAGVPHNAVPIRVPTATRGRVCFLTGSPTECVVRLFNFCQSGR